MKIAWRPEALEDLVSLHAFIGEESPAAAARVVVKILDAIELLPDQPGIGRPGRVPRTRELMVAGTPYIAAYRVKNEVLEVLRVLHGARKWPSRMASRRR